MPVEIENITIRTEAELQKYAEMFSFDEQFMRELHAELRYGTVRIYGRNPDKDSPIPETYWNALERLARNSGMTVGEYIFNILTQEVEDKAKHVTPLDDESRKYYRESWRDFELSSIGKTWAWDNYEMEIKGKTVEQGELTT